MKTVVSNIFSALEDDATLSYVRTFSKGGVSLLKIDFPFVNIGRTRGPILAETIGIGGHDSYQYSVTIQFGTKSMEPEVSYFGKSASGDRAIIKGVIDLLDDIVAVCRGNRFDGAFTAPANITDAVTDIIRDEQKNWVWVGEITIEGYKRTKRTF